MTYDEYKLDNADDEYARRHPERRGVYRVTVTRTMEMRTIVEVEASSLEDALTDAMISVKDMPVNQWTIDQDDFDTDGFDLPPGARDE